MCTIISACIGWFNTYGLHKEEGMVRESMFVLSAYLDGEFAPFPSLLFKRYILRISYTLGSGVVASQIT